MAGAAMGEGGLSVQPAGVQVHPEPGLPICGVEITRLKEWDWTIGPGLLIIRPRHWGVAALLREEACVNTLAVPAWRQQFPSLARPLTTRLPTGWRGRVVIRSFRPMVISWNRY